MKVTGRVTALRDAPSWHGEDNRSRIHSQNFSSSSSAEKKEEEEEVRGKTCMHQALSSPLSRVSSRALCLPRRGSSRISGSMKKKTGRSTSSSRKEEEEDAKKEVQGTRCRS